MHAERLLWGTVKPLQFAGRGGLDTHPLWVIRLHFAMSPSCPLYPRNRTLNGASGTSAFAP